MALINDFLVADISTPDILLGMDFLLKYGVIIDLREQCCSVMGKQFPLIASGDACQHKIVTVQTDYVVQPRSEAIISGVV